MHLSPPCPLPGHVHDDVEMCLNGQEIRGQMFVILSSYRCSTSLQPGYAIDRVSIRADSPYAHALAKNQVGEALVYSKGYDLHSDGTDRDHNKVVGHQVTTKEQGHSALAL